MAPWAVRNWLAFGRPAWLSSAGGVLMFMGNNPAASGRFIPWQEDLQRHNPGVDLATLDQLQLDALASATARRWILANPGQALRLALAKLRILGEGYRDLVGEAITASGATPPPEGRDALPPEHPLRRHVTVPATVLAVSSAALLAAGAAGVVTLLFGGVRRRVHPALAVVLAVAAYLPLLTVVFVAYPRLRLPFDLVLIVLLACGSATLRHTPGAEVPPAVTPGRGQRRRA